MKLTYKTILTDEEAVRHERVFFEPCCSDMGNHFKQRGHGLFSFAGEYGWDGPTVFVVDKNPGYYGSIEENHYPIGFCPFCGAKIECIEKEKVRRKQRTVEVTRTVKESQTVFDDEPA